MRVESRTVGQVASRQATVVVRVKNASPSELLSTVTVAVKEVPDGLKPAQTAPLTLAATLAAGATAEAPLPFGLTGNVERSLTVGVTISWLLEGLVPENVNIEGRLTLPACAFLKPTPISPEAFSGLLSSNTWHSSSARVSLKKPSQDPMSAVAAFANAHIVEHSQTSASMYTTSMGGHHIALLVKAKEAKLKIDLKSTSAELGAAVAAELGKMPL